jgi:polysaccharide biosynthesis/export protein
MNFRTFSTATKLIVAAVLFTCVSCVNTRKATYFNDIQNSESNDQIVESVIQKNDLLSINVSSLNPEATTIFNAPNQSVIASSSGTGTSSLTTGYLVDNDGNIVFPILGFVKAEGLTQRQLIDYLVKELTDRKLLVDPIVSVRLLNFQVTVLGEVNKPTVVPVPNGKISMLEAIGMAGDLTLFAKRDNVLLIRVENGKKITRRIDLSAPDFVAKSPYYYLKTNDVVYVESNKTKIGNTSNFRQNLPIVFGALSLLFIVADRINR